MFWDTLPAMAQKHRRSNCKDCDASGNDVPISRSGLCPECGARRMLVANAELAMGAGPAYDHWRNAWARAAGHVGRPITPYPPDA